MGRPSGAGTSHSWRIKKEDTLRTSLGESGKSLERLFGGGRDIHFYYEKTGRGFEKEEKGRRKSRKKGPKTFCELQLRAFSGVIYKGKMLKRG